MNTSPENLTTETILMLQSKGADSGWRLDFQPIRKVGDHSWPGDPAQIRITFMRTAGGPQFCLKRIHRGVAASGIYMTDPDQVRVYAHQHVKNMRDRDMPAFIRALVVDNVPHHWVLTNEARPEPASNGFNPDEQMFEGEVVIELDSMSSRGTTSSRQSSYTSGADPQSNQPKR